MNKNIILIVVLFLLYFVVGFSLQAVYGDSYHFMAGENYWEADGNGGWTERGNPSKPMPTTVSEVPPLITFYLPFFVPAFVLILFMFTPLGRHLETRKKDDGEVVDEE